MFILDKLLAAVTGMFVSELDDYFQDKNSLNSVTVEIGEGEIIFNDWKQKPQTGYGRF